MANRRYIFLLIILMPLSSCKKERITLQFGSPDVEISKTWAAFLNAIESGDKSKFEALSDKTIRCYDCLDNTQAEQDRLNTMRDTDSLWYDKIYEDMVNVPINLFLEQDFDLIFNPEFIKALKEKETTYFKRELDGLEY